MKHVICTFLMLMVISLSAQDKPAPPAKDTSWKVNGFFGLNLGQTALSNWQGGGENSATLNSILNFEALYKRDEFEQWLTKLDAQFGLLKNGSSKVFRKNMDQFLLLTKYSTKAFEKYWFWSAQADYRSQFAPGYKYEGDTIAGDAISDLNSPGYLQAAIGLDYKPNDFLSLLIAPVSAKMTFVNRQYLADDGAFGMEPAVRDTAGNIVTHSKRSRFEFGGRIVFKFKKNITQNVNLDSYLDLFSNYANPGNIDVVFNNLLALKINKFFTATVLCQMLYDDDIIVKYDWNKDGKYDNPEDINGPRLQVLTTFGIGLGYKF